MTDIGFFVEIGATPYTIPPAEAKALHDDIGMTHCRLIDSAVLSHPEEGIWRFLHSHLQENIKILRDCGIAVNLGTMWCPAHMAEGMTTYYPYTQGATCWNMDERGFAYPATDPRHGQHFADHRPWVANPPRMSGWYEYGQRLEEALGQWLQSRAWGNELGGDFYNPLVHYEGRWDEAYSRMWYEGAYPFFQGVLSVNPNAFLSGPDADGSDALRRNLILGQHAYGAGTIHPYAWGPFPQNSFERITDFRAVFDAYGHPGMEEWWTECGDNGTGLGGEWLETVLASARVPRLITWGNRDQMFAESDGERRAARNDYTLSAMGERFKSAITAQREAVAMQQRRRPSGGAE